MASLEFVLGIEIKRSNGLYRACEICKNGAGKYPKDFKWSGWHNGGKCHTISITMGMEEFGRYQRSILNGTEKSFLSNVKGVDSVPPSLLSFVKANKEVCSKQDWYKKNKKYFGKEPDKN
ncbi:MAG TPA: hypothetical protein VFC67_26680 [Prolixibacteraceae bacterium]|nr:hypothetical protein [Prolixibacteraceae bacterium]